METGESYGKLEGSETATSQTRLVALVFTDIVHSTALKHQLGDQPSAALIDQHNALVREVLIR
jgi:class 3 adenylate cyclase